MHSLLYTIKRLWPIILILLVSLLIRVYVLSFPQSPIPGDSYNFISITEQLVNAGEILGKKIPIHQRIRILYPSDKRLPVYPILLVPAVLAINDLSSVIWYMHWIGVFSSIACLLFLYLLGMELKFPRKVIYLTVFFCSIQPYFIMTSVRPLDKSFFAFMVLLSIYVFYWSVGSGRRRFLFGVVLGLTCMTRYEGFLLAAALFVYIVYSEGFRGLKEPILPFVVLTAPWFIKAWVVYGSPFHTGMLTEDSIEKGVGVSSINDIYSHVINTFNSIVTVWGVELPLNLNAVLSTPIFSMLSILSLLFMMFGFIEYVKYTKRKGMSILFFLFFYLLLISWWVPRSKLLPPIVPFLSLFLVLGILQLGSVNKFIKIRFCKRIISFIIILIFLSYLVIAVYDIKDDVIRRSDLGCIQNSKSSTFSVDVPPTTARYLRITLGDRSNISSKKLSLEEIEVYSSHGKLDLKSINGSYKYGTKIAGPSYSYITPPQGLDEGGTVEVPFNSGDLTDGHIDQSDQHSVYWRGPGVREIVFDLKDNLSITGLSVVYQGGVDRKIDSGLWYVSNNSIDWIFIGEWDDNKSYVKSKEVVYSLNVSGRVRYLKLRLISSMPILKLNEVTINTGNESIDTSGYTPDIWEDSPTRVDDKIPFYAGDLTDGVAHGLISRSTVIWSEKKLNPIPITFDLGRNYSIKKIVVYARFRDITYGMPQTTVELSKDGIDFSPVGVISKKEPREIECSIDFIV